MRVLLAVVVCVVASGTGARSEEQDIIWFGGEGPVRVDWQFNDDYAGDWDTVLAAKTALDASYVPTASAVDSLGRIHTIQGGTRNGGAWPGVGHSVTDEGNLVSFSQFMLITPRSSLWWLDRRYLMIDDDTYYLKADIYRDWVPGEDNDITVYGHGTLIPEPSTWLMLAIAAVVWCAARWLRRPRVLDVDLLRP